MCKIQEAKNVLAEDHVVDPANLDYIGAMDCEMIYPGKELLHFNVMDPSHYEYKSTITCLSEK